MPDPVREQKPRMKQKYGLEFPIGCHDIFIDLLCAKKWNEPGFKHGNLLDPGEHMLRAIRALFTREEWGISRWTEEHVHAWCNESFFIVLGAAACSKAQPLDSVVYAPSGTRTMLEIEVGDEVFGHDGLPTRVVKTHDVGVQEEYEVLFSDGAKCRCAGSHLWSVTPVREKGLPYRTVTTEWLHQQARRPRFAVPFTAPVQFAPRAVTIDPYVFGLLLGDGCFGGRSGKGSLRYSSADLELVEAVRASLPPEHGVRLIKPQDYGIIRLNPKKEAKPNEYIRALKAYGLWGKLSPEKHIPADYLFNSEAVRRDVLAGLLDTDGCVGKNGSTTFSSTSRALADGVAFLVRSLGGKASTHAHQGRYRKPDGTYVLCREFYLVHISIADPARLFRLERKVSRTRANKAGSSGRSIVSVTKTGASVPMRCITVANPRGLYLTDDFIVTHNSNDIGGLTVLDWITDPTDTISIMASTSKTALNDRSYESVQRYFQILQRNPYFLIPGKVSKTTMAIINDSEDAYGKLSTSKAAIRGVAVEDGSTDEARANLQGRHMPYVRLILDEMSAMRKAAAEARHNLRIGASKGFKFVGLANPDSRYDLACKFAEPEDGGWGSVDEDTPQWRSRYGLILHHNGFHSPAIVEPDGLKKYPYLIKQADIDAILKEEHGNADSKAIWTMIKGLPPPTSNELTILSEADITTFGMSEPVIWDSRGVDKVLVAGLDPAFTSDGDDCVLQVAEIGLSREGSLVCAFHEPRHIPIKVSAARPAAYQVVDGFREICDEIGLKASNVAIDDSGSQSIADIVAVETGVQPIRCNFGSGASEFPISLTNLSPANKRVRNHGTELWLLLAEFGRCRQLRGLPAKAAQQFCMRRFKPGPGLRILESKREYKKRLPGQRSPDEGDAAALCIWAARKVGGLRPGFNSISGVNAEDRMGNRPLMLRGTAGIARTYTHGLDLSRLTVYSSRRQ